MSNDRDDEATLIVVGENVALGPLRRDLLSTYHRWNNTVSTSRTLGLSWPTTIEQEAAIYGQRSGSASSVYFTVYAAAAQSPVGVAYLYEIDHRHRRATFGITIGDAPNRGKGYGTEATRLVLDYAFASLGLSNVMLTVLEFNVAGYRAYQKAGFREFGRRARCSFMNGRLWDLIYMQALADDVVDAEPGRHGAASLATP